MGKYYCLVADLNQFFLIKNKKDCKSLLKDSKNKILISIDAENEKCELIISNDLKKKMKEPEKKKELTKNTKKVKPKPKAKVEPKKAAKKKTEAKTKKIKKIVKKGKSKTKMSKK
jgi:hypothetical protein